MKPLKEIGRIMFAVVSEDGERAYAAFTPEAALRFADDFGLQNDREQDFVDGQFYSLAERRELVWEVWLKAIDILAEGKVSIAEEDEFKKWMEAEKLW